MGIQTPESVSTTGGPTSVLQLFHETFFSDALELALASELVLKSPFLADKAVGVDATTLGTSIGLGGVHLLNSLGGPDDVQIPKVEVSATVGLDVSRPGTPSRSSQQTSVDSLGDVTEKISQDILPVRKHTGSQLLGTRRELFKRRRSLDLPEDVVKRRCREFTAPSSISPPPIIFTGTGLSYAGPSSKVHRMSVNQPDDDDVSRAFPRGESEMCVFSSFDTSPRELDFQQLLQLHDEFLVSYVGGLESRVPEIIWGSWSTMLPMMLKNVRPPGIIADDKLPPKPRTSDLPHENHHHSALSTVEILDPELEDFWIKSLDKPSLEASINITNPHLIEAVVSYVMSFILKSSSDVNSEKKMKVAVNQGASKKYFRLHRPWQVSGLSHDRSTREDIIMFFQQAPGGFVRHTDFHRHYPKYDALFNSREMQRFENLWKSCTIWDRKHQGYFLNPACLPANNGTLFEGYKEGDDILSFTFDDNEDWSHLYNKE